MLYSVPGREHYVHRCDGKNAKHNELEICLHDVYSYILHKETKTLAYAKFCPYCGIEIEKDSYCHERSYNHEIQVRFKAG